MQAGGVIIHIQNDMPREPKPISYYFFQIPQVVCKAIYTHLNYDLSPNE